MSTVGSPPRASPARRAPALSRAVVVEVAQAALPAPGARTLAFVALACLGLTLVLGVLAGFKAAHPLWAVRALPMQLVQPLHTFMAVGFVLSGAASLTLIALGRAGPPLARGLARAVALAIALFLVTGAAALLARGGSGLEYLTWPRGLTALPVAAYLVLACAACARVRGLARLSPEGAWLLLIGVILIPLGLAERVIASSLASGYTARLTTEWHALDAAFAGWNAALYGLGILLTARPGAGKPLRPAWLFAVAAFALLSTFGHHHYASPQPQTLKSIALVASMLGGVSFVRHVRAALRGGERSSAAGPLLHAAEQWTLFSLTTGILLAVPQINSVLHGTHAIVGHAMCSMIGVSVMLVLGCLVHASGGRDARLRARLARRARAVSACIALIALCLGVAGLTKGLLRVSEPFVVYQRYVLWALAPLPWLGIALTASLAALVAEVVRAAAKGE